MTAIPGKGWLYALVFLLSGIGLKRKGSIEDTCSWILWLAGLAYFASFAAIGSGAVMRYLGVYALLGPAVLAGRRANDDGHAGKPQEMK